MNSAVKKSISVKLLRIIFALYLSLVLLVTTTHVLIEYANTRQDVLNELKQIERTFSPLLQSALWDLDHEQLDSIIEGILNLPMVVGVAVVEFDSGRPEALYGKRDNEYIHSFSITKNLGESRLPLAEVSLYTSRGAILDRIKVGFIFIILNALIISISLFLLLRYVLRRYLFTPLNRFTSQLSAVDLENIHFRIDLDGVEDNELKLMELSFNTMLQRIERDKYKFLKIERQVQQQLEDEVERRTQQLQVAFEDAEDLRAVAERANQSKSNFLANMSHELRTPLHGIMSFSSFGIKKSSAAEWEKANHYFKCIHSSGECLLLLLDDLLDLSKLEAGKMTMKYKRADIRDVVKATLTEQQANIHEHRLEIEQRPVDFETEGEFDFVRIRQVLTNLISNAIKFAPQGSKISLSILRGTLENGAVDAIGIGVADCGMGVPDGEIEMIFDKFIQSSATTTGAGGTGLGLAISRDIIAEHNGRIWAENRPEGGALFQFLIPVRRGDPAIAQGMGD